ncbi:hypothetical protein PVAND_000765 [Polypedilum vanderplanki]|uniref:DNA repair protein rad9 n=1 Tax=Polypedilum vanderplanki TaxID=319348 RepID=A0A9J6BL63_POLVA|nr:hypothetical protein PVAND_000765 [Polypedilum vanderplanki]
MRLIIIKEDLNVFTKIIKFLARVSPEIYLILNQNSMTLKAIDLSETIITFAKFKSSFFYGFEYDYIKKENWTDPECNPNIFLLSARCLLIALKQAKSFATCTFLFDNDQNPEKLVLEVEHSVGYKIRKQMYLLDIIDYSKGETSKYQIIDEIKNVYFSPSVIHNYINNLKKEMDELELVFTKNEFKIKNSAFEEETLKFNIKLDKNEFSSYNVINDEEISFVIKSNLFFQMIDFAKSLDDNKLNIYFTKASEPISTVLEMPKLTVNAVQSTINKEGGKYCRKKGTKVAKAPKPSLSTTRSFTSLLIEDFNFSEVTQHVNLIDENDQVELSNNNGGKFQFKVPTKPNTSKSNRTSTISKLPSSLPKLGQSASNSNILNPNPLISTSSIQKSNENNNNKRHSEDAQEKRRKRPSIENDPVVVNESFITSTRIGEQQENFTTVIDDDDIEMDASMLKSQQLRQSFTMSNNSPLSENMFFKNNKPSSTSTQQHKIRTHPVMSTKFLIPNNLEILCPGSDEEEDD